MSQSKIPPKPNENGVIRGPEQLFEVGYAPPPKSNNPDAKEPKYYHDVPAIKGLKPVQPGPDFRDDARIPPYHVSYVFINGGMGDYICWTRAVLWVAEHCPWVHGFVVIPDYMHEFMRHFFNKATHPNWKVIDYNKFHADAESGATENVPIKGPLFPQHLGINATGAHLFDCGAAYFAGQFPLEAPHDMMPRISDEALAMYYPTSFPIQSGIKYAVITPNAVQNNRRVPGAAWNPIIAYLRKCGIVPVLLGKTETLMHTSKAVSFSDDNFDKDGIVDWRDKTTIMQAAAIMSRAQMVIGMDNGLLHLAACTDVPLVFGYNIAAVKHRRPRRPADKICIDVVPTKKELPCIGCQSDTNQLIGFDFNRRCFYEDYKCLDLLFDNNSQRWVTAIAQILNMKQQADERAEYERKDS